jgi:hypothetical protein
MKNYLISERQFKKIVEQVESGEDEKETSKDSLNILSKMFGGNKKDVSGEDSNDELSDGDPVQQFFNSLK